MPLPGARRKRHTAARMTTRSLLAIIAAIIAVIVLSQLLYDFYDWNQQQACATGGGRNCGAPRIPLNRQ